MSFSESGKVSCFANYRTQLDGRWVALVGAENDAHLYTRPDNSELRKAAEEAFDLLDEFRLGPEQYAVLMELRAALEGK